MKKINVKKIFKYDPTLGGMYSKYEGYFLIGLQKISPHVVEKRQMFDMKIDRIFCSELARAKETALAFGDKHNIETLKELNEIRFNLKTLLSEKEYKERGSNLVRERFIDNFIDDNLLEKRNEIKVRIDKLLNRIYRFPDGEYLLISHSFFMKILHVYLLDNGLFENPKLLEKYFDTKKKTFDFGKGFGFNVE